MKTRYAQIIIGIAATVYASAISSNAQQFQNLDFESPLGSPPLSPGFYYLPDWTLTTVGEHGSQSDGVYYESPLIQNNVQAYMVSSLYSYDLLPGSGGNYESGVVPSFGPLNGSQSVALYVGELYAPASISVSQTSTIPAGQNSVSFLLGFFNTASPNQSQNPLNYFSLTINSQNIPLAVTSENGDVLNVAGSISQWAGQTVSLSISETVGTGYNNEAFGVIDDVAFSPVAVPESSGMGFLAAALSLSVAFLNKRKLF